MARTETFNAEQARWVELIGRQVQADAIDMDGFGEWSFDEHPLKRRTEH
ncbi:hypothetical protein FLM9_109 [Candidatus Synechococcus spongiarum]|uniref:Uncharacterized protein n=1 Tax=Candidatus Synechococcus spongiarum TaxID=431041 RepID=A0A170T435_9SYNE|nr:hypothetical protein FLM9_109 [Candidatus Synechococcus spongiarum]